MDFPANYTGIAREMDNEFHASKVHRNDARSAGFAQGRKELASSVLQSRHFHGQHLDSGEIARERSHWRWSSDTGEQCRDPDG